MSNQEFSEYLEERLHQWAEWYSRGNLYGLGFPSCSIEYRMMREGAIDRSIGIKPLPVSAQAEEMEALVKQMSEYNLSMANALRCHYFMQGSLRKKSLHLKISHTNFKYYVDMAHQWLAGRLSERSLKNIV